MLPFLLITLSIAFLAEPVQAQLSVGVRTDKYTYQVGETVGITVSVNMMCEAKLRIIKPDGSIVLYTLGALKPGAYSLTGTADYPLGRRTVLLEAQYEDYSASASTTFEVIAPPLKTYSVKIFVTGFSPDYSTNVFMDEKLVGTMPGGTSKTFTFDIGTSHTISVDPYVSGATGTRYGLFGGAGSATWELSSTGEHTFGYGTEYKLTIIAEALGVGTIVDVTPEEVTPSPGSYWYPAGNEIAIECIKVIPGPGGTQYRFQELYDKDGDRSMTLADQGTRLIARMTMDRPYNLIGRYDTYYYLTVKSPYGNPTGEGWYKPGAEVTISVTSPVPMDGILGLLGGKCNFREWALIALKPAGTNGPAPLAIRFANIPSSSFPAPSTPVVIEALWDADYTMPILAGVSIFVTCGAAGAIALGYGYYSARGKGRRIGRAKGRAKGGRAGRVREE